jgi:hypothetical protein
MSTSTCMKCSAPVSPSDHFCGSCGHDLRGIAEEAKTVIHSSPEAVPWSSTQQLEQTIIQNLEKGMSGEGGDWVSEFGMDLSSEQREETVIAIDVSGSMSEKLADGTMKIEAAKQSAITFLNKKTALDRMDRVALVAFNHEAHILVPMVGLCDRRRELIQGILSLRPGGGTHLHNAAATAQKALNPRPGIVSRLELLTDGNGTDPRAKAQELKDAGVVIDIIGIGPDPSEVNEDLLRETASTIQGQVRYQFLSDRKTVIDHYGTLGHKSYVR